MTANRSGKMALRMPKALHDRLADSAKKQGVSINHFVVTVLASHVGFSEDEKPLWCRDCAAGPLPPSYCPGGICRAGREPDPEPGYVPEDSALVTFLYMLMRDELPSADVVRCVNQASKARGRTGVYTAKGLESYARELAARLSPLPGPAKKAKRRIASTKTKHL